MATVFRERDRRGKLYTAWRFRFKDASGRWRRGIGWPDRKRTEEHALNVEAEARAIRNGEKPPAPAWLEARGRSFAEVVAEYLEWGRESGGIGGRPWEKFNAGKRERWLAWWGKELNLSTLADLDDTLSKVERSCRALRASGLAPGSVSLRVTTLRAFAGWCVRRGLLGENPIRGMKIDSRTETPHRALTEEETGALLRVAPPERNLWYRVALATGYRLNELRHLTGGSLALGPSLRLSGEFTKNRKDAAQPIPRELADELTALAAGRPPEASLLNIPTKASALFQDDRKAAGIRALTEEGGATWQSLRKSFVTAVVASGADLKTAMTLARHSAASLTMEVYAARDPASLREAAEAAARRLREPESPPACPAGVRRKAVGAEVAPVTPAPSGKSRAPRVSKSGFHVKPRGVDGRGTNEGRTRDVYRKGVDETDGGGAPAGRPKDAPDGSACPAGVRQDSDLGALVAGLSEEDRARLAALLGGKGGRA